MRLFGIGIDVVEVSRIEQSLEEFGEKFLERIFTKREREYCERQKKPAIHFAARFAAKEAVSKAFGTGIGKEMSWLDLEILRRDSGEPSVILLGRAAEYARRHGLDEIKVSLTHAEHYAAANAVVLASDKA